jgi:hypothetical protein
MTFLGEHPQAEVVVQHLAGDHEHVACFASLTRKVQRKRGLANARTRTQVDQLAWSEAAVEVVI